MKAKYMAGQRLAFIARNKCTFNGSLISGKWSYFVGYVKKVRRTIFGTQYIMQVSGKDDIYIVPQRDVISALEKRDSYPNKHNKTNENAD